MKELTPITELPGTKEEINHYIQSAKDHIMEGYENPLKFWKHLKAFEKVIAGLLKDDELKEVVLDEAGKEGLKRFSAYGAEFEIGESGTKYDFSVCGHSELDRINERLESLNRRKKEIEKELKSIPQGKSIVNDETGEVYSAPQKKSETGVKVTIK